MLPPGSPTIECQNPVLNIHSCRRSPACPNGASSVRPSPVPKPSSEIEKLCTWTLDMFTSCKLELPCHTLTHAGSACKHLRRSAWMLLRARCAHLRPPWGTGCGLPAQVRWQEARQFAVDGLGRVWCWLDVAGHTAEDFEDHAEGAVGGKIGDIDAHE